MGVPSCEVEIGDVIKTHDGYYGVDSACPVTMPSYVGLLGGAPGVSLIFCLCELFNAILLIHELFRFTLYLSYWP